jgi:hypothetical protein
LIQRIGHLAPNLNRGLGEDLFMGREKLIKHSPQRDTVDILHHYSVFVFEILKHPHNTAMLDLLQEGELLHQLLDCAFIRRVPQLLDRHEPSLPRRSSAHGRITDREVDRAEVSCTQLLEYFVGADEASQRLPPSERERNLPPSWYAVAAFIDKQRATTLPAAF